MEVDTRLGGLPWLRLMRDLGQKIIHLPENIRFVRDENVMIRIWQPNDTSGWNTSLKRICLCLCIGEGSGDPGGPGGWIDPVPITRYREDRQDGNWNFCVFFSAVRNRCNDRRTGWRRMQRLHSLVTFVQTLFKA